VQTRHLAVSKDRASVARTIRRRHLGL